MGDRLATIDMGRKVGGTQQLPTFRPMSILYVHVGFLIDHSRTDTRVDKTILFGLNPTTLCELSVYVLSL